MIRFIIIGLITLSMSGCVQKQTPFQRQEDAFSAAVKISNECYQKRQAGELPGVFASAQCSNARMRQTIKEGGYPYMDLVDLFLAYRLAGAKRVDAGLISSEELGLQIEQLWRRLINKDQKKNTLARPPYNFERMWIFLMDIGVWKLSAPDPAEPPGGPITCYQDGNMVQCD